MAEIITINERMIRVETQLENINSNIVELKALVVSNNLQAETKYASKQVENIVYGMVGVILIAFITAVIAMVFKKKNNGL